MAAAFHPSLAGRAVLTRRILARQDYATVSSRLCSRCPAAQAKQRASYNTTTTTTTTTTTAHANLRQPGPPHEAPSRCLDPDAANPPFTTRPPPIDLPAHRPDPLTISYLFATGKAFLKFYKTALKYIWVNTKLAREKEARFRPSDAGAEAAADHGGNEKAEPQALTLLRPPRHGTRARLLLHQRWRHDMRRLPVFALLLMVFSELTPVVAFAVPSLMPFPCRIPAQVEKLQRQVERRRAAARAALPPSSAQRLEGGERPDNGQGVPTPTLACVARSLGLVSRLWDRAGLNPPMSVLRRKVMPYAEFIVRDDTLIREAGGLDALEKDEVRLACAMRGMDVLGKKDEELQKALGSWLDSTDSLRISAAEGATVPSAHVEKMCQYLAWPENK